MSYEMFETFFDEADADGSGEIDIDEMVQRLRRGGYPGSEKQIKAAFVKADVDGDGNMSFEEFMLAMGFTLSKKHKGVAIWRVFLEIDINSTGYIKQLQFTDVLTKVKKHFMNADQRRMTDLALKMKGADGSLDYMAFLEELTKMGIITMDGITYVKKKQEDAAIKKEEAASLSKAPASGVDVEWRVSTHYYTKNDDACLAILGDLPELGSWNPNKAVLGTEKAPGAGVWSVRVSVPANTNFEWKWVVIPKSRERVWRWELDPTPPRPNRSDNSGSLAVDTHRPWWD